MRRVLLAIAVITVAAAAAWWWLHPREPEPLQPGWEAVVTVLAGDGVDGWRDGEADRARFSDPFGVAVGADGTIYVAEGGESHRIRRISAGGQVSTLAGGERGFADGVGARARFDTPSGIAIDRSGTLYIADTGNNAVRRLTPDGMVSTLAGDGIPGYGDGPGPLARFNGPIGIAVDSATGQVIVADTYNDLVRIVAADGTVSSLSAFASNGEGEDPGSELPLDTPSGVAVDAGGTIYVADTGNGLVRRIGQDGTLSTPGPLPFELIRPVGIAVGPDNALYVTDDRGRIVEIAAKGSSRVVAGAAPGFRDGPGSTARFRRPAGLAVAAPGRLVVADAGNALVRLVAARSQTGPRLPASPFIAPQFDDETFGRTPLLWPATPMDGPHEVAGTLGEARGGEGSERFHAGVDVRVEQGTFVHAVRDGFVSSPLATGDFGSLNEWLRIGPLTYVHIRAGRTRQGDLLDPIRFVPSYDAGGQIVRMRVKRGARFTTGDVIASVNAFNHVHLNVGWPGEEHNPLRFRIPQFEDTIPPTIARGGVRLFDQAWQPLTARTAGRLLVSGQVRIVVDAWDQAEGNHPGRRLGLYSLGYQVLRPDGTPAPGFEAPLETMRFDRLSPSPTAASLVFAPGSGIPFYGRRVTRFLYTVTNSFRHGVAREGYWDTTLHTPGDYVVRVHVGDFHGNARAADERVRIEIPHPSSSIANP